MLALSELFVVEGGRELNLGTLSLQQRLCLKLLDLGRRWEQQYVDLTSRFNNVQNNFPDNK
eukprot:681594-Amphidinium_carterae.1